MGGVFKNKYADDFIKKIEEYFAVKQNKIRIINEAHKNPALLFAQKTVVKKESN